MRKTGILILFCKKQEKPHKLTNVINTLKLIYYIYNVNLMLSKSYVNMFFT